jgi:hypothetical protein
VTTVHGQRVAGQQRRDGDLGVGGGGQQRG